MTHSDSVLAVPAFPAGHGEPRRRVCFPRRPLPLSGHALSSLGGPLKSVCAWPLSVDVSCVCNARLDFLLFPLSATVASVVIAADGPFWGAAVVSMLVVRPEGGAGRGG